MKRISNSFIEDLKNRTDLVSLVKSRIDLKKKGNKYWACCPFHHEKSPSFTVDNQKNFYYCFGCRASGNAISFLMDFHQYTYVEAIQTLADFNNLAVEYEESSFYPKKNQQQDELALQCLAEVAEFFQQQLNSEYGKFASQYLLKRNIKLEAQQHFLLGFANKNNSVLNNFKDKYGTDLLYKLGLIQKDDFGNFYDYFRNRLMFPIKNQSGKIIAFGGRAIEDIKPKYLNSPEHFLFNKKYELYGLDSVLVNRKNHKNIIITEGYLDVISLWQEGFDNAVAALGTAFGETHLQKITKYNNHIYFAFDGDEAGKKAAERALNIIFQNYNEEKNYGFIFLPSGEDPDSFISKKGSASWLNLVENSLQPSKFLLQILENKYKNTNDVETQSALLNDLKQNFLNLLPTNSENYRQLLSENVKNHFKINIINFSKNEFKNKHRYNLKNKIIRMQNKEINLLIFLILYPNVAKKILCFDYPNFLQNELPIFWELQHLLINSENTDFTIEKFLYEHHLDYLKNNAKDFIPLQENEVEQILKENLLNFSKELTQKMSRGLIPQYLEEK